MLLYLPGFDVVGGTSIGLESTCQGIQFSGSWIGQNSILNVTIGGDRSIHAREECSFRTPLGNDMMKTPSTPSTIASDCCTINRLSEIAVVTMKTQTLTPVLRGTIVFDASSQNSLQGAIDSASTYNLPVSINAGTYQLNTAIDVKTDLSG